MSLLENRVYTIDSEEAKDEYQRAEFDYLYGSYPKLADKWVVGCLGTEVPLIRDGRWQLYVFNFYTGEHGWLDMTTDIVEADGWRHVF